MSDWLAKLQILYGLLEDDFKYWWGEIAREDLDTPFCCDGRDCGCYGTTTRECYFPQRANDD